MQKVIIEGSDRAMLAASWAETNVSSIWELDLPTSSPFAQKPSYTFKFSDSKAATIFALRWK